MLPHDLGRLRVDTDCQVMGITTPLAMAFSVIPWMASVPLTWDVKHQMDPLRLPPLHVEVVTT